MITIPVTEEMIEVALTLSALSVAFFVFLFQYPRAKGENI